MILRPRGSTLLDPLFPHPSLFRSRARRAARARHLPPDRAEPRRSARLAAAGSRNRVHDRLARRVGARRGARQGHQGRLCRRLAKHPPPRLRSEEHTSELQSLMRISYAVFCLKKKKNEQDHPPSTYLTAHHIMSKIHSSSLSRL